MPYETPNTRQAKLNRIAQGMFDLAQQYIQGVATLNDIAEFMHQNPLPNVNGLLDPNTGLRYPL